jgi:hypothetical protein
VPTRDQRRCPARPPPLEARARASGTSTSINQHLPLRWPLARARMNPHCTSQSYPLEQELSTTDARQLRACGEHLRLEGEAKELSAAETETLLRKLRSLQWQQEAVPQEAVPQEEEDSHARQLRPPGTPLRQETTRVACATPYRHQSTSPIGMSAAPPTFQLRAPDGGAPSWKTTTAGKVEPPPRNGWTCGTCLRTFATQGSPTRPLSTHTPHPCPRLKT